VTQPEYRVEGRPTRTDNIRLPHRGMCCVPVAFDDMAHSRRSLAPLLLFSGVACVLAHAFSSLPFQIRFPFPVLNWLIAVALAWTLPTALVWLAGRTRRKYVKVSACILALAFALGSLVFSMFAVLGSAMESGVSWELLSEAKSRQAHYRLYRTDCGATCAFGLALRQEYDLPLRMKVISPVWSLYRESEGAVSIEGSTIRVRKGPVVLWEQS
jgi:hypothetical protein